MDEILALLAVLQMVQDTGQWSRICGCSPWSMKVARPRVGPKAAIELVGHCLLCCELLSVQPVLQHHGTGVTSDINGSASRSLGAGSGLTRVP